LATRLAVIRLSGWDWVMKSRFRSTLLAFVSSAGRLTDHLHLEQIGILFNLMQGGCDIRVENGIVQGATDSPPLA